MRPLIVYILVGIFSLYSISGYTQDWKYDFEEAISIAKNSDQQIALVFTGSDWCPPCKRLEKNILMDKKFQEFAGNKLVWVRADFPRKKENKLSEEQQVKNDALADRFNKRRKFPTILIVDSEGKVLKDIEYKRKRTVEEYIDLFSSIN